MVIEVEAKQWGNSIGVIIPSEIVKNLKIKPGEKILVGEIERKENPLKELFGFGKRNGKLLTQKARLESRKMLESKYW